MGNAVIITPATYTHMHTYIHAYIHHTYIHTYIHTGATVNPIIKGINGLEKDARGRLMTDNCLRAKGSKGEVYVLGDNAVVQGM